MDNGVESLLQTMEKLKEESTNDEFTKEVEEHKKKAEGKVEQPEVSTGAVKAVAVTKEEVEQIDEISSGLATSYLNKREPQHKPNMNTPETSNRDAQVAKGIRGAVSRMHGYGPDKAAENKVTGRMAYRKSVGATHTFNKEEVELDEASYSAKAARAGEDIGKPGKMFDVIAKKAGERYGSIERGKKVAGELLAKLRKEEVEELTDEQLETIFEQIDIQLNERSMTEPEMKKREEIVKSMKKNLAGFKERYGEKAKSVMYATATKQAMKD